MVSRNTAKVMDRTQAVVGNHRAAKTRAEATPKERRTPLSVAAGRGYESFLQKMPVVVVLTVLWVVGAALLGSCALALYTVGSLLVPMIGGGL